MKRNSGRLRPVTATFLSLALLFGMWGGGTVLAAGGATLTVGTGQTYATLQAAIAAAGPGDTIQVAAGTYTENVNVNKAVTIIGNGAADTRIVAADANSTPLTFSTSGATVKGFTITHAYTATDLQNWNFNNNGVTFNQFTSGNTLQDCTVTLNRNGIYLNNCQGNHIAGNTIFNNRTGINMTNNYSSTAITGNTISANWTLGIVMYSQGIAADLSTVTVTGNRFDQNWYSEIEIKDSPTSTGTLDVNQNVFTDSPVTYTDSSDPSLNEPSFSAQKPDVPEIGGTAAKPARALPTLRIYNSGSVVLKYDAKTLNVGAGEAYKTIQPAIDAASDGDTVNIDAGTYDAPLRITGRNIMLQGTAGTIITSSFSPAAVNVPNGSYYGRNPIIFIQNSTVTLKSLEVKAGQVPVYNPIDGITAVNSDVTLDHVTVDDIRNSGGYNGMQYGRGLTVFGADPGYSTVTVSNCAFGQINKNAIHLMGNVSSMISDSAFTGSNQDAAAAAQNGIVLMNGATGTITGCMFSDFRYQDDSATSTGILAYSAGMGIRINGNSFSNNQTAVYNENTPSIDANNNYWGSAAPDFSQVVSGDVSHTLWYSDAGQTKRNDAVYGVTVSSGTQTLTRGTSFTLTAAVDAGVDADKTVTWTTSAPGIATVDVSGKVEAVKAGTATITATAGGKSAACAVTVVPDDQVNSVTLNKIAATLTDGDSLLLTATVSAGADADTTVAWTTSAPSIATVDASGKVTAVKAGNVNITATVGGKSAVCAVTVVPDDQVNSVTLDKTSASMTEGDSLTLAATVNAGKDANKTITWTTSDPGIATVDAGGKVTAVKAGNAMITATVGSVSASCGVTVSAAENNPTANPRTGGGLPSGWSMVLAAMALLGIGTGFVYSRRIRKNAK